MLTCNNLTLRIFEKKIFSNLGLTLLPGACVVVKGANGTGKTSLLKVLSALHTPTKGSIYFQQNLVEEFLEEYHCLCAYVGHEQPLNNEITVLESLSFWANIYEASEKLAAAISCFGLEELSGCKVSILSKGWKVRVMLARLLLVPAKIWFLDEPFSNLDSRGIDILCNMIDAKCANGGVVILTTHQDIKQLEKLPTLSLNDFK